jgi:ketosteroid isomerase-like protein
MRTQTRDPGTEAPALTAEHMRRTIMSVFHAYETGDRAAVEAAIADEFSFTSPYDDAIDREEYFRRCWPHNETTRAMKVERIFIEGDAAFVTYLGLNTSGGSFRNTEYFVFRAGKIASVEVYFGPEYRNGAMEPASPKH